MEPYSVDVGDLNYYLQGSTTAIIY